MGIRLIERTEENICDCNQKHMVIKKIVIYHAELEGTGEIIEFFMFECDICDRLAGFPDINFKKAIREGKI